MSAPKSVAAIERQGAEARAMLDQLHAAGCDPHYLLGYLAGELAGTPQGRRAWARAVEAATSGTRTR